MRLSDEEIRGRPVISADGQVLGEVTALYLETVGLRVSGLQVKLKNEVADRLGADRSLFHSGSLEIPVAAVQSVGDTVVLALALDGLRPLLPAVTVPAAP